MIVQVLFDSSDEIVYIAETSPADTLFGQVAEPAFDHVQPGTRSRDKVQLETWMPPEPGFHPGVLVGPVIVHNQMQIEIRWRVFVDFLEEPDEFLVPMPRHAVADDFPIEHTQGSEQGGGAIAFVVVRHCPTAAFLQRKARLSAIEGLDLAFLVDAQDQALVWRILVEPDDIIKLLDKLFVPADLEGLDQMGFETVLLPNPLNAHWTDTLRLGHTAHTPVSCSGRLCVQGRLDHRTDFPFGDAWDATGTRSILFQARHSKGQKALPPQLDGWPGDGQLFCNVLARYSIGRHCNDSCPLYQAQRDFLSVCPCH